MATLVDKIKEAYAKGESMPLKGHTKITLTNVSTGEKQVIEKDNIVTNAIADILSKNWGGLAQFYKIMPLRNLYSGVMCFAQEITENADNYNPPADNVNQLIAHAGDEMNATASTLRGNPNAGETDVTDTSIKYVWDWSTNQGNGTISTVCLCGGTLGNMGLKPVTTDYNPCSAFGGDGKTNRNWSAAVAKEYPWSISSNGKTAIMLWVEGTTFTEYTRRHDYLTYGVMRSTQDWQEVSNRTATLTNSFTARKSFIFDDADYYYVAVASDSDTLNIDKISKSDMTVTNADYNFTGVSIYTGNFNSNAKNNCWKLWAYDGTYLYYPNSDLTKFYGLNINNPADPIAIPETISISDGASGVTTGDMWSTPVVISAGLVVGDNYIINGGHAYQIKQCNGVGTNTGGYSVSNRWLDVIRMGAACYGDAFTAYSGSTAEQCAVLMQMFLSTINVLETPVVKNNAQTMKIEYTITEA